jgi:hypothetical protein
VLESIRLLCFPFPFHFPFPSDCFPLAVAAAIVPPRNYLLLSTPYYGPIRAQPTTTYPWASPYAINNFPLLLTKFNEHEHLCPDVWHFNSSINRLPIRTASTDIRYCASSVPVAAAIAISVSWCLETGYRLCGCEGLKVRENHSRP